MAQTTKEILKLVEYQIEQIFTQVKEMKEDNHTLFNVSIRKSLISTFVSSRNSKSTDNSQLTR